MINHNKKLIVNAGKITLLMVSIIISLFLGESIVRLFDLAPKIIDNIGPFRLIDNPHMVYEFIPGSNIDGSIINKQGFKDKDFVKEKPRNIVRIAMLGDSITQGMYVPLGKTFSDQLEKLLNQKAIAINSKLKYEVMNFGVGGYNLGAEVETLRTKVIEYQPDIVVLNFFHNDNEPFPGIQLFFIDSTIDDTQRVMIYKKYYSERNSVWHKFNIKLLSKSKLYSFLIYRIRDLYNDKLRLVTYCKKYHNSIIKNKEQTVFYNNLLEIEDLKKKFGFKFMICLHPHLLFAEHPNNKKFAQAAEIFNFPYFHMFEYYKKENLSLDSIQVNKNDQCHPNELGHLIIIRAMFTELKKNGFIDKGL